MKKMLTLVLALMMALTMIGAASADEVLTVVTWDATTTPYLIAQEAAFEAANPGVDLQYIDVASQDYAIKVGTMLSGGDTSDVVMVKEITDIVNWSGAGYATSLNDYIAAENYDLSGFVGMEANYAFDGVQYALPFRSDFWVLFYNKDLFDAAGVAYPTNDMTWDQYAELAKTMTSEGVYGTHYHTWLSAVANWAVCDGVNTLVDGEYSDLAYFYNLYQGLEDAGACMAYNELKASGLHYSAAFANGNVAMMPMGYWYVSTLIGYNNDGTCNFNWGITAVPHADGVAAGSSFGNLTGVMVNEKAANKDLAWKYVAWLCGEEGAAATASTGSRPAWVSENVAGAMSSVAGFPADEASKAALLPSYVAVEMPAADRVSEISTIVNEEHTMIMTREIDIDEGIEEMNERFAELFE
ncbi:MAG: sugar ABC transporter substrate-binding protein [Clostridiales bacterium]|nr:sugar ABC transporter substrate-binding protein [Clostridiales bacterium]